MVSVAGRVRHAPTSSLDERSPGASRETMGECIERGLSAYLAGVGP